MLMLCRWLVFLTYDLFFFKQKTAYEMRISDWSSDVCSSDLFGSGWRVCAIMATHRIFTRLAAAGKRSKRRPGVYWPTRQPPWAACRPPSDRKSVVSGKSVSVRGDLVGRRILEKTKQKSHYTHS